MNSPTSAKKELYSTITRVGPKHQITIPNTVFRDAGLEVGDYLEVRIKEGLVTMAPKKLISKDQAWFYTPEWQAKEREADEDIAKGNLDGPFDSAKELVAYLRGLKKKRS
jgi:bifunctional DNA-binding transcriptional regulator/antitoxin component of YhaV-PrlF toxin-antitoxin module